MHSDSESYLDWHRTKKTHPDQHKNVYGRFCEPQYWFILCSTCENRTILYGMAKNNRAQGMIYGRCRMNFAILFPLRERVSFLWCYLGLLNRENNGQCHERRLDPCGWNLHIVFFYCLFFFRYCLPLYMYLKRNRMEALLKCASW